MRKEKRVSTAPKRDYSLIGQNSKLAIEQGLAAAEWYHTDIPRARMKELMRRRNGPALIDTVLWFSLLIGFGFGGYWFWGSWACVPFFLCYGVLYGSASNARWHEYGHGTAFKTSWLNDVLYQVASFMYMFEPTFWRWSHARHHTDTVIVGRDREIAAMRPPNTLAILLNLVAVYEVAGTWKSVLRHALGRVTAEEADFIPEMQRRKVYREARAWILIYACVIGLSVYLGSVLPLMFIGFPTFYGRWLVHLLGLTQHAGLAENVLDHRLNSRTIYMNPVFQFVYWNMNYHLEHHMFPMVPYHALPKLHAEMLSDTPPPYRSTVAAYREIIPALLRQRRDPSYYVERPLPATAKTFRPELHRVVVEA
jgi:fatty acid desaturase